MGKGDIAASNQPINHWLISLKGLGHVPQKVKKKVKKVYQQRGQRIVVACAKTKKGLFIFDSFCDAGDGMEMHHSSIRAALNANRTEYTGRFRFYYEADYKRKYPDQPMPDKSMRGRVIRAVNVTKDDKTESFSKIMSACKHVGITKAKFYAQCRQQGGTRKPEINGYIMEVIYG